MDSTIPLSHFKKQIADSLNAAMAHPVPYVLPLLYPCQFLLSFLPKLSVGLSGRSMVGIFEHPVIKRVYLSLIRCLLGP